MAMKLASPCVVVMSWFAKTTPPTVLMANSMGLLRAEREGIVDV